MSDRSDDALRERMELASYATRGPWVKNSRSFGCVDGYGSEWHPTVESQKDKDICYLYDNDNAEDDAAHIAASSPDVVRADLEEILALRAEVARLRAEHAWLLQEVAKTNRTQVYCPMPDRYECLYHVGDKCLSKEDEMRVCCWRTAVECAVKCGETNNAE